MMLDLPTKQELLELLPFLSAEDRIALDSLISSSDDDLDTFAPNLLPWQRTPYEDQSPILLLTGSAGGGKSRLAGQIMHRDMQTYSGAMGLILRKTRESMNNSTVLFYERRIIGKTKHVHHNRGQHRFEYEDTNSIVAYGGMKDEEQREQVRSIGLDGGLDRVWMEEGTRFVEPDLNELLARMRGTASPYTQIVITTNPDSPTHFIKTRLIDGGQASVYFSSAIDNPHNPPAYIDTLKQLTGIQGLRLRDGKWVQAEGVVYDNWDTENVDPLAEYNPTLPVIWGVDDGYASGAGVGTESYHPRVILFAQETAQGGFNVFAEYYATNELSEKSIANCLEQPYARPEAAYADSSAAELRGRLWAEGIMTVAATHPVHEGIKNLRRLICDGNGVRLFRIHPRCVNLAREMATYRYDDATRVASIGEPKPLKLDDHGPDTARYLVWHARYT
jgi:PBSX family phage terminase large subunit